MDIRIYYANNESARRLAPLCGEDRLVPRARGRFVQPILTRWIGKVERNMFRFHYSQKMAELVTLGVQVAPIMFVGANPDGNLLNHFQAKASKAD